jgi:hypothetical protein
VPAVPNSEPTAAVRRATVHLRRGRHWPARDSSRPYLEGGQMTWLSLPVIFCAYLLGRMGGVLGVVVVGAAVLIITILEVLRYLGFSVSGGDMTWSNLITFGLSLVAYLLGLRAAAKKLLDPDRLK